MPFAFFHIVTYSNAASLSIKAMLSENTNVKHTKILLPTIIIVIIIIIIIIIIIKLTHSKTIPEITAEMEPQPAALDFKKLAQYSSRFK